MVSNLSKLWVDDIEEAKQKARQEGRQEERQEMIRAMAGEGIPIDLIAKTAKLSVAEVKKIIQ